MSKEEVRFRTSCEKCFFAEWEEGVQLGCKFNRIETFARKSKLAEQKEGDFFFIINGFCNTCRDDVWASKYENPMEQVKEEIRPRVHVFVIDKNNDTPKEVESRITTTVDSLINSTIRPKTIHLLIQNPNIGHSAIEIFNKIKSKSNIETRLSLTYQEEREIDMVDSVISLVTDPYYMIVTSGEKIDQDYIAKLDNAINSELLPVVMSDRVYLTGLHRSLGGNKIEEYRSADGDSIVLSSLREKIMILVDEQKNSGAVLNF